MKRKNEVTAIKRRMNASRGYHLHVAELDL